MKLQIGQFVYLEEDQTGTVWRIKDMYPCSGGNVNCILQDIYNNVESEGYQHQLTYIKTDQHLYINRDRIKCCYICKNKDICDTFKQNNNPIAICMDYM